MPNHPESADSMQTTPEQTQNVLQPADIPLVEQAGLYIRLKVLEELEATEQKAQ
ncbi:MAG: hypothetical protein WCV62_04000 [Candidatus Peribacteraceae bacterium]|jgi:hypothetical protein